MSDLIRREDAIERATKEHDFYRGASTPTDKARRDELLNVMCWLGELPSAEPKRATGKWIRKYDGHFLKCEFCNRCIREPIGCRFKFCPNCGARMEVDHEND